MKLTRLERVPSELEPRIRLRVDAMLNAGLVAEVERLLAAGLKRNPSAVKAIGYRETIDVLEGRLDQTALATTIVQNTKALVKKTADLVSDAAPGAPGGEGARSERGDDLRRESRIQNIESEVRSIGVLATEA